MPRLINRVLMLNSIILLLISCSPGEEKLKYEVKTIGGVETYFNKNIASVEDFDLELKETFVLYGDSPDSSKRFSVKKQMVDIDKYGNTFIGDMKTGRIIKFDKTGKFIKDFGGLGDGPGEFKSLYEIIVVDSLIYGFCQATMKVNIYDLTGEFKEFKTLSTKEGRVIKILKIKDKFVSQRVSNSRENGKIFLFSKLVILDHNFNVDTEIYSNKVEYIPGKPLDPYQLSIYFTVIDDKIYIPTKSSDKYEITAFDLSGKELYKINKAFYKVKFSKRELDRENKQLSESRKSSQDKMEIKDKFKAAIYGIWADKNGRLFTLSSREDDGKDNFDFEFNLDVFKDGIFLANIKLPRSNDATTLNFKNDKIVLFDRENMKIKFYTYK